MSLLAGKKGLILNIANDRSIAAHIAGVNTEGPIVTGGNRESIAIIRTVRGQEGSVIHVEALPRNVIRPGIFMILPATCAYRSLLQHPNRNQS